MLGGRALALAAVTVVVGAGLSACTAQPAATRAATSPAPTTASPAPEASATPTSTGTTSPPQKIVIDDLGMASSHPCILRVSDVQQVMADTWRIASRTLHTCVYRSGGGSKFRIRQVQVSDPKAGLTAARSSCTTVPRDVRSNGGFACVKETSTGTLVVVGNVIAERHLWAIVIVPSGPGPYRSELKTMTELLAQVRV